MIPNPARFWSLVHAEADGCWLWQGYRNACGYGLYQPRVHGRQRHWLAHRLAYALVRGPIPDGMSVCHTCDVRNCVRPDHLWLGTQTENDADMVRKGRQRGACGVRNRGARVNPTIVAAIRAEYQRGEQSQREIGMQYGLSQPAVSAIIRGRNWTEGGK